MSCRLMLSRLVFSCLTCIGLFTWVPDTVNAQSQEPLSLEEVCQEAGGTFSSCGSDCEPCYYNGLVVEPTLCTDGCTPRCACPDGLYFDGTQCTAPEDALEMCEPDFFADACSYGGGEVGCAPCPEEECVDAEGQRYYDPTHCLPDCRDFCHCPEGELFNGRQCEPAEVEPRMCMAPEELSTVEEYDSCVETGGTWSECQRCDTYCADADGNAIPEPSVDLPCPCISSCDCPPGAEFQDGGAGCVEVELPLCSGDPAGTEAGAEAGTEAGAEAGIEGGAEAGTEINAGESGSSSGRDVEEGDGCAQSGASGSFWALCLIALFSLALTRRQRTRLIAEVSAS